MMRENVIFGQQDISRGVPFPRIDLVAKTGKPITTPPMYVRAADYSGDPEDQFIHSVVPIHSIDGNKPQRLFIYTEKV
jgi:hypothetical protein